MPLSDERPMLRFRETLDWVLLVFVTLIPVVVVPWLGYRGLRHWDVAGLGPATVLLKVALVVYYLCWCYGLWMDGRLQLYSYTVPPNRGRLTWGAYLFMAALCGTFTLLCYLETFSYAVVLFGVFFLLDHVGWVYLMRFTRDARRETRATYAREGRWYDLARFRVVESLVYGWWKCGRGLAGGAVILLMVACLVAFPTLADAETLGQLPPALAQLLTRDFALAVCMLAYVLLMEGWIWVKRFKAAGAIAVLDELERESVALSPSAPDKAGPAGGPSGGLTP